jgi:hypothetical protein
MKITKMVRHGLLVSSFSDEMIDKLINEVGKGGYGPGLQLIELDLC